MWLGILVSWGSLGCAFCLNILLTVLSYIPKMSWFGWQTTGTLPLPALMGPYTFYSWHIGSVQFSSVAQLCPTFCDPMNHSTPGLPVQHQLPESTQIHVHWVDDAIQPSHPLSSPSPPALNLSQNWAKCQWSPISYDGSQEQQQSQHYDSLGSS